MGGCESGNCYGIHAEFQPTSDGKAPVLQYSPYEFDIRVQGPANVKVTVYGSAGKGPPLLIGGASSLPATIENAFIPLGHSRYNIYIYTDGPHGMGKFGLPFYPGYTNRDFPL